MRRVDDVFPEQFDRRNACRSHVRHVEAYDVAEVGGEHADLVRLVAHQRDFREASIDEVFLQRLLQPSGPSGRAAPRIDVLESEELSK